jgi:predicted benzoate:H+ symporter BenE
MKKVYFPQTSPYQIDKHVSHLTQELLSAPNGHQPSHESWIAATRACIAFFLGGICAAIRFSCLAAFIPMGVILALQQAKGIPRRGLSYLFGVCALHGFLGLALTIALDRYAYGFWAIPLLGNFHFNVALGERCPRSWIVQCELAFTSSDLFVIAHGTAGYRKRQLVRDAPFPLVLHGRHPCAHWDAPAHRGI